jgi:predicted RNA-binding protein with TRAM domain
MPSSEHEITLDKLTYGGEAMGRLADGRAVFVPFGLPGEMVRIQLTQEKQNFARGEILEILKPSPDRIEANANTSPNAADATTKTCHTKSNSSPKQTSCVTNFSALARSRIRLSNQWWHHPLNGTIATTSNSISPMMERSASSIQEAIPPCPSKNVIYPNQASTTSGANFNSNHA